MLISIKIIYSKGNVLYAVGGFDGKTFLRTIEYLNCNNINNGWSMYYKQGDVDFQNDLNNWKNITTTKIPFYFLKNSLTWSKLFNFFFQIQNFDLKVLSP